MRSLIGEHLQVVQDGGSPVVLSSIEDASRLAGFDVRQPRWLPTDTTLVEAAVTGENVVRVTAT